MDSELDDTGIVRLPRAFASADAHAMCERIWQHLAEAHGVRHDARETWTIVQPTGFQALTRSRAFQAIGNATLRRAIDEILGPECWTLPAQWGAPLVTFPVDPATTWEVPRQQWHLDFVARLPLRPLPGVRVLAFIATVAAHGGGTLVIEGSHRLVERMVESGAARGGKSADVREALVRDHAWFRALMHDDRSDDGVARFMRAGDVVDGVPVRVTELTGGPGDVVLMHPWTLHAPSPNCGKAPRMMVSYSVFRSN